MMDTVQSPTDRSHEKLLANATVSISIVAFQQMCKLDHFVIGVIFQ